MLLRNNRTAPPTPACITLPINETKTTPNIGTDEAKQAPKMLILNIENSPPKLTIDNMNEITYITTFLMANIFENIFNLPLLFSITFSF